MALVSALFFNNQNCPGSLPRHPLNTASTCNRIFNTWPFLICINWHLLLKTPYFSPWGQQSFFTIRLWPDDGIRKDLEIGTTSVAKTNGVIPRSNTLYIVSERQLFKKEHLSGFCRPLEPGCKDLEENKLPLPCIVEARKLTQREVQRHCLWYQISKMWYQVFRLPSPRIPCHPCRLTLGDRKTSSSLQSSAIFHPPHVLHLYLVWLANFHWSLPILSFSKLMFKAHWLPQISLLKTHVRENNPQFFTAQLTWEAYSVRLGGWFAA